MLKHVASRSYPTDETVEENKLFVSCLFSKDLGALFFEAFLREGLIFNNREGGLFN